MMGVGRSMYSSAAPLVISLFISAAPLVIGLFIAGVVTMTQRPSCRRRCQRCRWCNRRGLATANPIAPAIGGRTHPVPCTCEALRLRGLLWAIRRMIIIIILVKSRERNLLCVAIAVAHARRAVPVAGRHRCQWRFEAHTVPHVVASIAYQEGFLELC